MTLTNKLLAELNRFGSATHPLARTLPGIVKDALRSRRWLGVSLFLSGIIVGGGGSLWVVLQRLDAMAGKNDTMAAACLNPGKPVVTGKAASQVIVQRKEDARTAVIERRKEGVE